MLRRWLIWLLFAVAVPFALSAAWAGLVHWQACRHLAWTSEATADGGTIRAESRTAMLLAIRGQDWLTDPADTTRVRLQEVSRAPWYAMPRGGPMAPAAGQPIAAGACWLAAFAVLLAASGRRARRSSLPLTGRPTVPRLALSLALWAALCGIVFWTVYDRNHSAWWIVTRPEPPLSAWAAAALVAGALTALMLRVRSLRTASLLSKTRGACVWCRYPVPRRPAAGPCPECGQYARSRGTIGRVLARRRHRNVVACAAMGLVLLTVVAWWLRDRPRYAEFLGRWLTLEPLNYDAAMARWD